ncbi:MAG: hypothetical protein LBQ46_11925 [Treponema sp.]|jgi:hypothetical protein|nr:hypothetical protein [Treponema sp.]
MLEEYGGKDEFHKKASTILDTIKKWLAIAGTIIGILLFAREVVKKAEELLFAGSITVPDETGGEGPVRLGYDMQVNLADYIINCCAYLEKPVPDAFKRTNAVLYELADRNIKGGTSLAVEDNIVVMSALLGFHDSTYEAQQWLSHFYGVLEELGWKFDKLSRIDEFALYYKDGIYGCIFEPEKTETGLIIAYVSFTKDLDVFFKYELLKYKPRE